MKKVVNLILCCLMLMSCGKTQFQQAMKLAGNNRQELRSVIAHYDSIGDEEKIAAVRFLIENMPAHFSYEGNNISEYYKIALDVLQSDMTPKQQCDSLLSVQKNIFPDLDKHLISDIKIIKADFLIKSIDNAFHLWRTCKWAEHLNFDEFCEWLLPYKVTEKQQLDNWRDTLSRMFSDSLRQMLPDDEEYGTTYKTAETIRKEIIRKVKPSGMYTEVPYLMLNESTMPRQTFGRCYDYVNLSVATFRSLGVPAVIDETPIWGRFRAGHTWFAILSDRGEILPSEWDISSEIKTPFFPYQRISKIYRNTYKINNEIVEYFNKSVYKYPFGICKQDVTNQYFKTSDIEVPITQKCSIIEDYVYICNFNGFNEEWTIVDYGICKDGKACFKNLGRNVLYIVFGYDGIRLKTLTEPFILHSNGSISYIKLDTSATRKVLLHRKYFQSAQVVAMRQRIINAKIQAANNIDFSDATDIFVVSDVYLPDKQIIKSNIKYRYWRYLPACGTYGSIAELAFYNSDSSRMNGKPISSSMDSTKILNAFDNNWLTNFETENPNGNWIGMDFSNPVEVSFVRIVPRSDDNDIHPGDTYELKYWNNSQWLSLGKATAVDNYLIFDDVPKNSLLWLKDLTQGYDERIFLVEDKNKIVWL